MITEDYVSFETAKLLKEKGFDLPVHYVYHYWTKAPFFHRKMKNFNSEEYRHLKNEWYSAPTQFLAMKWLREVHGIFIDIVSRFSMNADLDVCFSYSCKKLIGTYKSDYEYEDGEWLNYEEAAEAAIKYCLENMI